jgi:hypothetical protein
MLVLGFLPARAIPVLAAIYTPDIPNHKVNSPFLMMPTAQEASCADHKLYNQRQCPLRSRKFPLFEFAVAFNAPSAAIAIYEHGLRHMTPTAYDGFCHHDRSNDIPVLIF